MISCSNGFYDVVRSLVSGRDLQDVHFFARTKGNRMITSHKTVYHCLDLKTFCTFPIRKQWIFLLQLQRLIPPDIVRIFQPPCITCGFPWDCSIESTPRPVSFESGDPHWHFNEFWWFLASELQLILWLWKASRTVRTSVWEVNGRRCYF